MKKKIDEKTLQSLREAVSRCKTLFNEKRLNESSFEDLIAPQKDFLDNLKIATKEAGLVSLNPEALDLEKVNIQKVLSVSEEDTDANDGTLSEAFYKKNSSILQQLSEVRSSGRSYKEIVTAYKREGGNPESYEAYQAWAAKQPDAEKASVLTKRNFTDWMLRIADVASDVPVDQLEPSKELKNLIDMIDAGEDFVETATDTVTTKYELIELKLRRVIRGKSIKRYYLLAGDAGIGKTYIVNQLLAEAGLKTNENGDVGTGDVPVVTGSIGRNPTTVAEFLWRYRDEPLVVMDDCDTFLRKDANPDVSNMLKGAMEPGTHFHVHITSTIAKRLTKMLKTKSESVLNEDELATDIALTADNEIDDDDENSLGDDDPNYVANEADGEIPTDWTFNARLIIISNLHEATINEALWSRCDHFDLHLTQEEYLVRLAMIINDMDIGQKDGIYTEEQVASAKALIMTVLEPLIEAGNKGIKMFGKYIHLKEALEFRLIKDIADMWLSMVERYMETHPGASEDDAKKVLLKKWVRVIVIPRISA